MSFDRAMSYNNTHRRNNFSVTTGKDGQRSFYNDHDNRFQDSNNNRSRGSYRSRGGSRGNRGNRGRSGGSGYRNFNSSHSRFKRNGPLLDDEGDDTMGDSGDNRAVRGRYNKNRARRRDRGTAAYRGGGATHHGPRGFGKNQQWFRVIIPGPSCTKDELKKLLSENIDGQLNPVNLRMDSERAVFYIEGRDIEGQLRSLSRRLHKPNGEKMVIITNPSQPPESTTSEEGLEKLKLRMSERYDTSTQVLDLSSFYSDDALSQNNLYFPLNRPQNMVAVTEIIKEYIPELVGLDLSNNKLLSLQHIAPLAKATPTLKSLNLGGNQIRKVTDLERVRDWSCLTEINLDGNDLCNDYSSQNPYISAVRKIFPKIMSLDGAALPPPITFDLDEIEGKIPPSVDCYFVNQEIQATLVTFIKEYFTCFDTDKRRDLMAAYHEHAQFSLVAERNSNIEKQPSVQKYIDDARNLIRIGHLDSEKLIKKTKIGVLAVVSFLETLPKTTHDIQSFKVDLTLALPSMISFVLVGIYKEDQDMNGRPCIRSFSRSLVIVPCGSGMVITNDLMIVSNPANPDALKDKFKPPTVAPPSNAASTSAPSAPPAIPLAVAPGSFTPEQVEMVAQFSQQSGMNQDFSFRCLQENNWDYQKAGQVFTQLQSEGKIPADAFVKS